MKWGAVILVAMGLAAALFAALLVKSLLTDDLSQGGGPPETDVLLASKDMPAMSVIESTDVTVQKVAKAKLPVGYLSSPAEGIGKILAMRVVEGQVLAESCFIENGAAARVAASLPAGMRAVSVSLSNDSITGGLLYPGCVVDVLASFKLPSSERGQAISTTLLREVQVLAVRGASVVSEKEIEQDKSRSPSNYGRVTVTLMVDPKQAEALQLATENGMISLALRNPLDKGPVDTEATVLSQGRLAQLGSAMTTAVMAGSEGVGTSAPPTSGPTSGPGVKTEGAKVSLQKEGSGETPSKSRESWPVTVIRGSQVEQEDLDMPADSAPTSVKG
jgi:pilus assembly protein CpaB